MKYRNPMKYPVTLENIQLWLLTNPDCLLEKNIRETGASLEELNKYPTKLTFFYRIFSSVLNDRTIELWSAYEQAWTELNDAGFFNYDVVAMKQTALNDLRKKFDDQLLDSCSPMENSLWEFDLNVINHDDKKYFRVGRIRNLLQGMANRGLFRYSDLLSGLPLDRAQRELEELWTKWLDDGRESDFPPERIWIKDVQSYKSWIFSDYLNPENLQANFITLLETEYMSLHGDHTAMITPDHYDIQGKHQIAIDAYNLGKKIVFRELESFWKKMPEVVPNVILSHRDVFW